MAMAGLVLILAGVLGFFSTAFADPYTLPKVSCIFGGAFLIWISLCRKAGKNVRSNCLGFPVLIALVAMLICTAMSIDPVKSIFGPRGTQSNSFMAFAAVALVALAIARSNIAPKKIALIVLLVSIPGTIYAVTQGYFADPFLIYPLHGGRVIGAQGSPLAMGAVLCCLAPVAVYFIESGRGRLERAVGVLCLALICWAVILTKTRGAMLGLAAGVSIQAMALWPMYWRRIASAMLVFVVGAFYLRDGVLAADIGRIETWKIAWLAFLEKPVVGWGPDVFRLMFRGAITPEFLAATGNSKLVSGNAHNDILQVAATMGIVGLLAYAAVAWSVTGRIVDALLDVRRMDYAACALGCAVALWVCAKMNPIPLSAMVIVAVMLAPLYRTGREVYRFRRPFVAVALCSMLLALSVRLNYAEAASRECVRALNARDGFLALKHSSKAAELNPWDPYHIQVQLEMIRFALPLFKRDQAQALVLAAIRIAEESAAMHPNDADVHETLGVIRGVTSMVGLPSQVEAGLRDLERAQALAPTFKPIARRRMTFARFLGDRDALIAAGAHYGALTAIERAP